MGRLKNAGVVALLLSCIGPATAADDGAVVAGRVVDDEGRAVAGATVEVAPLPRRGRQAAATAFIQVR